MGLGKGSTAFAIPPSNKKMGVFFLAWASDLDSPSLYAQP